MHYPDSLRKTPKRIVIFQILQKQTSPISVSEIYKTICNEDIRINYSTIYRTLTAFQNAGILTVHNLSKDDEALYELKKEKHKHYAICLSCKSKIPLKDCPISSHITELEENDFHVTEHHVEIYGFCKKCREK